MNDSEKQNPPVDSLTSSIQQPETTLPVIEDENSISYLGVTLPKAEQRGENTPKPETYADFINDPFSQELQKKIAVCWQSGEPLLIEGGTSIGKTTTAKKMASELGYEVHYVNLNGLSDPEALMGRYIPNATRKSPEEPEYLFADGPVTAGLRQEEDKIKVIIVDEINAARPEVLIRMHEVLDVLERGGKVSLTEDAAEKVAVDKTKTKIIALMNPPGKGYFGREPLDPAQLRRWVYQKETTDLPDETMEVSAQAAFGIGEKTVLEPSLSRLKTKEHVLSEQQLAEIPGIDQIIPKYLEFHKSAKALLEKRDIAADQPQPFTFDDRMELKRVRDFVARFYDGDINETVGEALTYYYLGKVERQEDKQKLKELISHVSYIPSSDSRRLGLEDEARAEEGAKSRADREIADLLTDPAIPDSVKETLRTIEGKEESAEYRRAQEIMGEDFFGTKEVENALSFELTSIPEIPYSEADLEKAKELGQMLILRVGEIPTGEPMTMKAMNELLSGKFKDGHKVLYNTDWYKDQEFYTTETVKAGWALVSKEVIPGSTNKNYLEQAEVIINYLQNSIFAGESLPSEYQEAVDEFESQRDGITELLGSDLQEAAKRLEQLKITQITRQTPAEAMYDLIVAYQNTDERLLPNMYTWTSRRSSDGYLVYVGYFESDGVYVGNAYPGSRYDPLGVSFSRSQ